MLLRERFRLVMDFTVRTKSHRRGSKRDSVEKLLFEAKSRDKKEHL